MSKRLNWLDSLRGLAMFFVILGHAFLDKTSVFRKYIYSFHMPLFFFISGMTYKEKNLSFKDYFKDKCKKLLLPYLCLNVFVFIIKVVMNLTLGLYKDILSLNTLKSFFSGIGSNVPCVQSWFLLTLFLTEILFYLVKQKTSNDKNLSITVITLFIIGCIYSYLDGPLLPWHLSVSLIALLYYYLGYIAMKYITKLNKLTTSKYKYLLIALLIIVSVYVQSINSYVSINGNRYGNILFFLISSVSSILLYFMIANIFMDRKGLFKEIGVYSIFYLGYHGFILTSLKEFAPSIMLNPLYVLGISILDVIIIYPIAKLVSSKAPILIGKI